MEAGVGVQVEQYTDFWRELPVVNTENRLAGRRKVNIDLRDVHK